MNFLSLTVKTIAYVLLSICFSNCGQAQYNIDEMLELCCSDVEQLKTDNIESIHKMILDKHVYKLFRYKETIQHDSIFQAFSLKLQSKCPSYLKLMYETYDKDIWKLHDEQPKVIASIEDCQSFESIGSYYYPSDIGEVILNIEGDIWFEQFQDGTYSKLKFVTTKSCEFYLEFIESNNMVKMNFSKKGDKYYYHIIDKGYDSFTLSVQIPNSNQYYTSPMNFKRDE